MHSDHEETLLTEAASGPGLSQDDLQSIPTDSISMRGQWTGRLPDRNAFLILDIDELRERYVGSAMVLFDVHAPRAFVRFETLGKGNPCELKIAVEPVDPYLAMIMPRSALKERFPDVVIPMSATLRLELKGDTLRVSWETEPGRRVDMRLPRSEADKASKVVPKIMDWEGFKEAAKSYQFGKVAFRGQSERWRLRTGYHRTGRANLDRFMSKDIKDLHRYLSGKTKHFFDLNIPDQNGAFMNLVQHHGYPTPLLDWTYSPFVASYFAYKSVGRERLARAASDDVVRIYMLDIDACNRSLPPISTLTMSVPHFSILEFIAVENERMIPQQALSAVSNIDDIETYLLDQSAQRDAEILSCIDLPVRERDQVMRELRFMGITAGSLFPGLDGSCEEIRDRMFDE